MTYPAFSTNMFAISTVDPRFDPRAPLTVNGFPFVPLEIHSAMVTELLEANNREVERRRKAEREQTP